MNRSLALVVLVAVAYFAPNIWSGGLLVPLDILHNVGPFSAAVPHELQKVRNPHLTDLVTMIYPWTELFRSGGGFLPLWNPYSFCGSPLIASAQTGLLFPLSWLYKLFPMESASIGVALAKLLVCGIFSFLYYRRAGLGECACLIGAISYMLSGQIITWLGYPGVFPIVVLPFLFWALEAYLCTLKLAALVWISVGYGALFLGSQPQFGFVVAAASGLYFVVGARHARTSTLKLYGSFMGAAFLGFCLASPQILPFWEYLRESAAFRLRGTLGWKQYPWFTFVSWIVPRFFGDLREGNFWGFSSMLGEAVFVGVIPLVFASAGLFLARKNRFYRSVLIVFAFALGGLYIPFVQALYQRVPLLSHIDNNKFAVLISFALASLAAASLDRVLQEGIERERFFRMWLAAAAFWTCMVGVGLLYFRTPVAELGLARFETREVAFHALFLALAALVLYLWKQQRLGPQTAGALLLLLTVVDVFRVWAHYYPSFASQYRLPHSSSVEFLQRNIGESRFLGLAAYLPPETSVLYRLQDVRGIEGLTPFRHYRIMGKIDPQVQNLLARLQAAAPEGTRWSSTTLFYRSLEKYLKSEDPQLRSVLAHLDYWSTDISRIDRPHLLSVLGVRFILGPKGTPAPAPGFRLVHSSDADIWENPGVLPRAFVCRRPMYEEDEEKALEMLATPKFPIEKTAVICVPPDSFPRQENSDNQRLIPARILKSASHSVEITADSPGGWLVLSDLFYPGWKAYVDDIPAPIYQANYLFRAVRIPSGQHQVRFVYRPASFFAGLSLAILASTILGVLGLQTRKRERFFSGPRSVTS